MPDLISKPTRIAFREAFVGTYLGFIDQTFDGVDLVADETYSPPVQGSRRIRVEQYYAKLNFASPTTVAKILRVFEEVILWLSSAGDTGIIDDLLNRMRKDGYEYDHEEQTFFDNHRGEAPLIEKIKEYAVNRNLPELQMQIGRLTQSVDQDPGLAVGTAKELVETVCKTILEEHGIRIDNEDLGKLTRAAAKELRLEPNQIADGAKGADTIRRLLSNLGQMPQGLAELRNLYGTGHGRSGRARGIQPRHARLAVGAASTLAVFLLETHIEQIESMARAGG